MAALTDKDIAWMTERANDTKVPEILACVSVCIIWSTVTIILRVWGRASSTRRFDQSDWLAVVAWVFLIGYLGCVIGMTRCGLGRHAIMITNPRIFSILNICASVFFCSGMPFIKFSIVSFYSSIFPQKPFRWALLAVTLFMAAWFIAAVLVTIFQCTPIPFLWDKTIEGGTCINYGMLVLVTAALNVFTDFVVLALPVPLVVKLKVSARKKWLLILTFGLGSSACIIGVIRLPYSTIVSTTVDPTWDIIPAGLLCAIELTVAIFSASLPTYRPLYSKLFKDSLKSSRGQYQYPPGSSSRSRGNLKGTHERRVTVSGARYPSVGPSDSIRVTEEIHLSSHVRREDGWHQISEEDEMQLFTEPGTRA